MEKRRGEEGDSGVARRDEDKRKREKEKGKDKDPIRHSELEKNIQEIRKSLTKNRLFSISLETPRCPCVWGQFLSLYFFLRPFLAPSCVNYFFRGLQGTEVTC